MKLAAVLACAALTVAVRTAQAGSYLVFTDDRNGFDAALRVDAASTVVDTAGAFAPNPPAGAALASVTRSGTVAGAGFSFTAYDVNYTTAPVPPGTVTPGVAGGDAPSSSGVDVETPVAQGGAAGTGTWGLDSGGGSPSSRNALLVDFTTTPGALGIGHFALDLVDFEASAAGTPGLLRLYDGGVLVFSHAFTFPAPGGGNDEVHFLGVVAIGAGAFFDQALVVVGDDTPGGTGNAETWAADRLQFGVAHNPEPGTWALFGVGAAALAVAARRRRRRRPGAAPT